MTTSWYPAGAPALVCGHRGASATHPENTVAAAEAAIVAGASWIEFDVRPCADGLVVHHDAITAGGLTVAETTRSGLGSAVPSFAAFVGACGPLGLDIELKTDDIGCSNDEFVDRVLDEIAAHVEADVPVLVTSFDMDALDAVVTRRPDTRTGVLFHDRTPRWAIDHALDRGHDAIVPWFRLVDRRGVDRAHEAGLGVATWTVNGDASVRSMRAAGVDMIIGDDPAAIARALGEA